MYRSLLIGVLICSLLMAGCQHSWWQRKSYTGSCAKNPIVRWFEDHPLAVDIPILLLLAAAGAFAVYAEMKDGNFDLSGDSSLRLPETHPLASSGV